MLLSWLLPENAEETAVERYQVAPWLTARSEPAASAAVSVAGGRLDHTVRSVGAGCECRARARAVGESGDPHEIHTNYTLSITSRSRQ